jgi:hypothetical protein
MAACVGQPASDAKGFEMIANQTSRTRSALNSVEAHGSEPGSKLLSGFRENSIFFDG